MVEDLKSKLVGAWKSVSYVENPVDGSEPFHPLGDQPEGIIMYTPDGFMSAQLSAPDRTPFASGDWFDGTDEEYKEEASSYIAYSGPYEVTEDGELYHSMYVSLFPNWNKQKQQRLVELDGDKLTLRSPSPIMSRGQKVNSTLVWQRAS